MPRAKKDGRVINYKIDRLLYERFAAYCEEKRADRNIGFGAHPERISGQVRRVQKQKDRRIK